MDKRLAAAHAPALSAAEAVMLPALPRERQHIPTRRGTMAGRALLAYVKSAPAQRRKRW